MPSVACERQTFAYQTCRRHSLPPTPHLSLFAGRRPAFCVNSVTVLGRQSLAELAAEAAELAAAAAAAGPPSPMAGSSGPPSAATISKSLLALAVLALGVPIIPQVSLGAWLLVDGAGNQGSPDGREHERRGRGAAAQQAASQAAAPRMDRSGPQLLLGPLACSPLACLPPTPTQDAVADLPSAHFVGVLQRVRQRLAPLLLPPRFDSPRDIRWHSASDAAAEPIWDVEAAAEAGVVPGRDGHYIAFSGGPRAGWKGLQAVPSIGAVGPCMVTRRAQRAWLFPCRGAQEPTRPAALLTAPPAPRLSPLLQCAALAARQSTWVSTLTRTLCRRRCRSRR